MSIFISLVIFGLGLALFFITNNKIRKIRGNILIEDTKKELESLLTEFNGAAARNIDLIEAKIGELQETINKANAKMTDLDDKIARANRPIIVEKNVVSQPAAYRGPSAAVPEGQTIRQPESAAARVPVAETPRAEKPAETKKEKIIDPLMKKTGKKPMKAPAVQKKEIRKPAGGNVTAPEIKTGGREEPEGASAPLTRSEELKKYIQQGLTKQELIARGFMENEINLLNFLIRKNF